MILPNVGFNRDSLSGAALLLSYLASSGKPFSALLEELPHYEMIKTKIECASIDDANELIDRVKEKFKGYDMILTEGVKVVLPDAWMHVRPSNTEPIIRIIAEGKQRSAAEELVRKITG